MSQRTKKMLREQNNLQVKSGMSKVLTELGASKSAKAVLNVSNKKQLQVYGHVIKGSFRAHYGSDHPTTKTAIEKTNKLMNQWEGR
jgi:hypothetical protein